MNFTLYVDESGDFETQRGQWVLSGVLFATNFEACEQQLNNKLSTLPKELTSFKDSCNLIKSPKIRSMRDFHLTEFRRDFGHDVAVKMASKTFNRLMNLPFGFYCLATINHSKSALSNREKTYRVMLSDLLALCETVINENDHISKLDLVVASRTIDGELQTSISNINKEVINSLPVALEVDLATKGMVNLIGKHINARMDYANNSWGLICADFLANLNYHYKKTNEKALLNDLESKGKYSLFESFGNHEIRRANIAERDNDFILSMVRWVNIFHKNGEAEKARESIQRLFVKIFNKRGTSGSSIAFGAILDRLWRQNNQPHQYFDLANMLTSFETELIEYFNTSNYPSGDIYLFRLRNLILIINNHLGKTIEGFKIIKLQRPLIPALSSNPEHFKIILDFKIAEIEVHVNALDFKKALSLSNDYYLLIMNYKDIWQLLLDESEIDSFDNSRASIKSQMTLFRCNVLFFGFSNYCISEQLASTFEQLNNRLTNNLDISRYHNYRIMLLLKQMQPKSAVDYALKRYSENEDRLFNAFDLFWLLKAVNDALLSKITLDIQTISKIINVQLQHIDINEKGHPIDLVFREMALFESHLSNKSLALKYIKKSENRFNLENSEIGLWLKALINIHADFITGKMRNKQSYFDLLPKSDLIEQIFNSNIDLPFLEKVRYFSPY